MFGKVMDDVGPGSASVCGDSLSPLDRAMVVHMAAIVHEAEILDTYIADWLACRKLHRRSDSGSGPRAGTESISSHIHPSPSTDSASS
jgi:hypothetical protein